MSHFVIAFVITSAAMRSLGFELPMPPDPSLPTTVLRRAVQVPGLAVGLASGALGGVFGGALDGTLLRGAVPGPVDQGGDGGEVGEDTSTDNTSEGVGFALASLGSVANLANGAVGVRNAIFRRLRPLYSTPQEGIEFSLFTRRSLNDPVRLFARDQSSLVGSSFDPTSPTKILIHGFTSYQIPGSGGYIIKDAVLQAEDANVILVDWSGLDTLMYLSDVERVLPQVGEEVAQLMRMLMAAGADVDSFHLLGHSLGAHMAGHAGSLVLRTARAGRITGLDPAGPLFDQTDPSQRLDPSDAGFVDAIHTDAGYLGIAHSVGHVDFYPDGGSHVRPGCSVDVIGACSHCSVHELVVAAIKSPGSLVGRQCSSWDSFQRGACQDGAQAAIGINTDTTARGTFYLQTNMMPNRMLRTLGKSIPLSFVDLGVRYFQGRDPVAQLHC